MQQVAAPYFSIFPTTLTFEDIYKMVRSQGSKIRETSLKYRSLNNIEKKEKKSGNMVRLFSLNNIAFCIYYFKAEFFLVPGT